MVLGGRLMSAKGHKMAREVKAKEAEIKRNYAAKTYCTLMDELDRAKKSVYWLENKVSRAKDKAEAAQSALDFILIGDKERRTW